MSGHSKWSQIKHKKAITDAKKGQLFSKLTKEIMVAVRTGGSAQETNTRLRSAIDHAKEDGLPKENIERAVMRASGSEEGMAFQEFIYEATAAFGVMMIIEGITDNKNRATAEIKHILSEHSAKFAEPGSVMWNFEKIGTIEVVYESNGEMPREKIENAIIESGARDMRIIESMIVIETDFYSREEIRRKLESLRIIVGRLGHEYKAKNPIIVRDEDKSKLEPVFETLLLHDDVQEVYTNISEV